jgi:transketolase
MKTEELKKQRAVSWQEEIYKVANGIRHRVMEHTIKNKGGYLSQACSSAEIFATLYLRVLNIGGVEKPLVPGQFPGVPGPNNTEYFTGAAYNGPKSKEYDRFFLSPSQYSLVLYATLIEVGRMAPNGLDQFNKDGSVVEMIGAEHSPGMEIMTGSLGQGISQAAGIAMARKLKGETGRVILFMSDGECQTGQFWEAIQVMSHHKQDNMLAYVDINGYQCDGKVEDVMNIEPLDKRLEAFGARVFRINGHDVEALAALGQLKPDGRPTFILCDTDAARGVDILKERIPKMHYVRFTCEDERNIYHQAFEDMKQRCKEGLL